MVRIYRLWYLLALIVALVPPSLGWLVRPGPNVQVVDIGMAQAGEVLFKRDWQAKDPNCPDGDGLGPVFNARSCVACHNQGGPGGGGGLQHNVTMFVVRSVPVLAGKPANDAALPSRQGVVHAHHVGGEKLRETLKDVHPDLPAVSQPTLDLLVNLSGKNNNCLRFPQGVDISQRNTPALFGAKLIDEIPDRVIVAAAKAQQVRWGMSPPQDENFPVGRALHLAKGRVGKFGWKAQIASLSDFVQAACANELGLGNPGAAQPTPIYGSAPATSSGIDLTARQCDELTAFCASLPRPMERLPKGMTKDDATAGRRLFDKVGCADCHTPKLGHVEGIYSDLLLHRMGSQLVGGGSYGDPPLPVADSKDEGIAPSEWRTPPLWGVADSAPYLHDGRAPTLDDAIRQHGGQGARAMHEYVRLSQAEQTQLIGFLKTLRAPGN
jgi:CxxC motif-containing protein (DUF1111 family)